MNTISYLKEVYGYSQPIFIKDIRIGRKSKTAIRKELSRAVQDGKLIRRGQGIYSLVDPLSKISNITFEKIVEVRFVKDDYGVEGLDLDVYGYYTGQTFLNQIGISQQVPAVIEITTNKTSCKRDYKIGKRLAILRKSRVSVDRFNYKVLQFFDMFSFISDKEVKANKELLFSYIAKHLSKRDFELYIDYYPNRVLKLLVEEGLINAFGRM